MPPSEGRAGSQSVGPVLIRLLLFLDHIFDLHQEVLPVERVGDLAGRAQESRLHDVLRVLPPVFLLHAGTVDLVDGLLLGSLLEEGQGGGVALDRSLLDYLFNSIIRAISEHFN